MATQDLGEATRVTTGAIGAPGQRTFWLAIWSILGVAQLWLEKEQVQAIGLAIEEVVEQLAGRGETMPDVPEPEPAEPPASPDVELHVGRIALGYEEQDQRFVFAVHSIESDLEGAPTIVCRFSLAAARQLSRQAAEVVAAGRPRCPLCGAPINPEGHVCPRSNGHHELV